MASCEASDRQASPTSGMIDSQSVKTMERGGPRSFDAGKKVKCRERHIVTVTAGHPIGFRVDPADVQAPDGAVPLLTSMRSFYAWLRHRFAAGGYAGERLAYVLAGLGRWTVRVGKPSDTAKGFPVSPRRWGVERTFGWIGRCRRLKRLRSDHRNCHR